MKPSAADSAECNGTPNARVRQRVAIRPDVRVFPDACDGAVAATLEVLDNADGRTAIVIYWGTRHLMPSLIEGPGGCQNRRTPAAFEGDRHTLPATSNEARPVDDTWSHRKNRRSKMDKQGKETRPERSASG
jgi:hypothetical protein